MAIPIPELGTAWREPDLELELDSVAEVCRKFYAV